MRPVHERLHTCGALAGGGRDQVQRQCRALPTGQDPHQGPAGQVVVGDELGQHDDAQPSRPALKAAALSVV